MTFEIYWIKAVMFPMISIHWSPILVCSECRVLLFSEEGAIIPKVTHAWSQGFPLSRCPAVEPCIWMHSEIQMHLLFENSNSIKDFPALCVISPMGAPDFAFLAGELSTLALFSEKEAVLLDAGVWKNNTKIINVWFCCAYLKKVYVIIRTAQLRIDLL